MSEAATIRALIYMKDRADMSLRIRAHAARCLSKYWKTGTIDWAGTANKGDTE